MLGMFLGGIPEAAASAAILTRAEFQQEEIFALWSTVLIAGVAAAAFGEMFLASSESLVSILCQGPGRRRGACPGRARNDPRSDSRRRLAHCFTHRGRVSLRTLFIAFGDLRLIDNRHQPRAFLELTLP